MENRRPQGPTSISRRESIRGEGLVGRLWWKEVGSSSEGEVERVFANDVRLRLAIVRRPAATQRLGKTIDASWLAQPSSTTVLPRPDCVDVEGTKYWDPR
jgi:hypothetical protein